ncbi:ABC transporter permease [Rhodobacter ferrooxidans]|uniref:Binding-protein-dependent transport systems inner membrane component n=1 Tax=Rhodobacter ferrooxidans TaxID=371731 RepID=C8S0G2_9RHOB|nr:ABC transporter permease [Rhodobacter sp. SW2]EEW25496.1 binding-protein-dependent transport systems inner membrane component [Rhodobacter sp. SW2]
MAELSAAAPLTTADGRPLKAALASAQARARRRAFVLVLPLLAFVLLTFILPIGQMLYRSVYHDGFSSAAPQLAAWFDANPEGTAPDEAAFAALAADLKQMKADKSAGEAGTRINYNVSGTRSLFTSTARAADKLEPPYREALLALDAKWGQPIIWQAMRSAASPYTSDFYLVATDRERDASGKAVKVAENERIYLYLFFKTFWLSGLITGICLVLAFPIAHLLATLPMAKSNLLMILVLLPFWTSLLVRTTSWMVLLQGQGVVNNVLVALHLIDDQGRLAMINNETGTIIVMTHILLPFMILPLYSVMRTIPPSYARAARSLGATSWTTFRRIYLPQTLPGIGAGGLLVFILAVGYYITPALVGGADGQMISNLIKFHMDKSNWSLAAALAALLLAGVLLLYWLYDRLIGIDNLKLG